MKDFRWTALGFVLGLAFALSPSCGPQKPRCTAANCNGCCDVNGNCRPGDNNAECGSRGGTCMACAPTQVCQLGICTTVNFGPCSPQNCPNGCCTANGGCVAGNTTTACGSNGSTCVTCQTGQACENGRCVATDGGGGTCGPGNCAGCCRNGICDTSNSNLACGLNGVACVTCTGTQQCNAQGVCQSSSCNATTCPDGCCANGQCIRFGSQTSSQCGSNGNACIQCASGNVCSNGSCQNTGGCNPPCATGCCAGTVCVPGNSTASCGSGGAACQTCSGNQVCQPISGGGFCTTPAVDAGTGYFGDPCNSASQCTNVSAGNPPGAVARCKTVSTFGNLTYRNGYCTKRCYDDAHCGAGNTCIYGLGGIGEAENICLVRCNGPDGVQSNCRPGYLCINFGTTQQPQYACFPAKADGTHPIDDITDVVDAGPGANPGVMGSGCTADNQCMPPNTGFCWNQTLPDGGPSGYPGGSCSADCSHGTLSVQNFCGDGGVCLLYGFSDQYGPLLLGLCERRCTPPGQSTCRTGYVCEPLNTPGTGFCTPRCDNPGASCPQGQTCNTSTGLCQ